MACEVISDEESVQGICDRREQGKAQAAWGEAGQALPAQLVALVMAVWPAVAHGWDAGEGGMTMICQECGGTGREHRPGNYSEHVCHVCNGAGGWDVPPIAVEALAAGAVMHDLYRPVMYEGKLSYVRTSNWPSGIGIPGGKVLNPMVDLRETLEPVNSFCDESKLYPGFEDIDQEFDTEGEDEAL